MTVRPSNPTPERSGPVAAAKPFASAPAGRGEASCSLRVTAPWFLVAFIALALLAAVPILLTALPPLFDYPNHLARMHIIAALPGSPALRRFYEVVWQPIPNLAMDLIVPPLASLIGLETAGRLFVLATILLLAAGPALLARAVQGAFGPTALLGFLLAYDKMLFWGFLNYLFGLGLAFACFAGWMALRRRAVPVRLACGALFALLTYTAHLEAAGVYGVMVVSTEAALALREHRAWRGRCAPLLVAGAPFLLPLALLLLTGQGLAGGGVAFGPPGRKIDNLGNIVGTESPVLDALCLVAILGGLALGFWRGWLRLTPVLVPALAALGLVYLAMPTHVLTAYGADHRLPLALALLLVAALRWTGGASRARRFLGAALVLFLAEIASVALSWHRSERVYAAILRVLDRLEPGSLVAVAFSPHAIHLGPTPILHMPALAVIRRDAFVTTLFNHPSQQPLRLRPPLPALTEVLRPDLVWGWLGGAGAIDVAALRSMDALIAVDPPPGPQLPAPWLRPVAAGGGISLYRVVPPTSPAPRPR